MEIKDFINSSGRVSSTKTTEKYVNRVFPNDFMRIKEHSKNIGLDDCTFSEEIYHFLNDASSPILCKSCNRLRPKFQGLTKGYSDYCSSKCSNSSDIVKALKESAYIKKYGVNNPSKSPIVLKKISDSFDEKYGGNPLSLKVFKERIKNTNIQKYGTSSPMSNGSSLREKINNDLISEFLEKYKDLEIVEVDINKLGDAKIKCTVCNGIFTISKWNLYQRTKRRFESNPCTICNPIGSLTGSSIEDIIRNILNELNVKYKEKDRKILDGLEIDFYIDSKKIGIEANGIYWHSDLFKEKNYHLEKTKIAKNKGVLLIHIFEDEIINKRELVKERIKSILGMNDETIYARKCSIEEVSSKDASEFLESNHMQGKCGAGYRIGLYHTGELVSLMTFGDLRKNMGNIKKTGSWELIRFCNKKGVSVVGGASKLLNQFICEKSPKKIISYCDRRWSNGKFYEKIGFVLEAETSPNYWYFKNMNRENRFKYRKDQLVKMGYDPSKTESSIMIDNGFNRIYDCGSFRFTMDLEK